MFTISNFDGKTVSGTVNGIGAGYSGSLAGSGLTGSANGSFFGNLPGNPATETGGKFGLHGPADPAAGIDARRRRCHRGPDGLATCGPPWGRVGARAGATR